MDCNDTLIARRVLEVWRAERNTNWPHGLVGLCPAFSAADQRTAALRRMDGSAPQAPVITARDGSLETPDSNNDWIEVGATSNSTKEDWPKMPRRSKATGLVVARFPRGAGKSHHH